MMRIRASLLSSLCVVSMGVASASRAEPVVLQSEKSDVATLPAMSAHWLLQSTNGTAYTIFNADNGHILATLPANGLANVAISPDEKKLYVATTIWSREDHGTRGDFFQIYDAHTVKLEKEIEIPPRALVGGKRQNLAISPDGRWAYIYDMSPAAAVTIVDIAAGKVARTVDIPGCALVYPWKSGGFSSLCGNGSVTNVAFSGGASASVTTSKPFFDANNEPVYEQSVVNTAAGTALFITYSGKVFQAALGADTTVSPVWSLTVAAGQPDAGTGLQQVAWRPGGQQPFALNVATNRLYVLMHMGSYWTHKLPGSEIWVFDPMAHKLVQRVQLPEPATGVSVSPDRKGFIYAQHENGKVSIIDATSGSVVRTIDGHANAMSITPIM